MMKELKLELAKLQVDLLIVRNRLWEMKWN